MITRGTPTISGKHLSWRWGDLPNRTNAGSSLSTIWPRPRRPVRLSSETASWIYGPWLGWMYRKELKWKLVEEIHEVSVSSWRATPSHHPFWSYCPWKKTPSSYWGSPSSGNSHTSLPRAPRIWKMYSDLHLSDTSHIQHLPVHLNGSFLKSE